MAKVTLKLKKGSTVTLEHDEDGPSITYESGHLRSHITHNGNSGDVVSSNIPPLTGVSIVVDAGHGGVDSGAVNKTLGLHESRFVLDWANELAKELQSAGAAVKLTRSQDSFVSLSRRCEIANEADSTYFISLHLNSAESTTASGTEVLVFREGQYEPNLLAKHVLEKVCKITPSKKNRGIKVRPELAVIRGTKMPAILIELDFVSNDESAMWLKERKSVFQAAKAVKEAVIARILEKGMRDDSL